MSLFTVNTTVDEKYTRKVSVPQYLPDSKKPDMAELVNFEKYSQLIKNIEKSSLPEEEKKFLRFAATRHIVFNYAKIADYYAHSSVEMQELMEQSALVLLDFDDAIMNGYVKLTKQVDKILKESGIVAGKK